MTSREYTDMPSLSIVVQSLEKGKDEDAVLLDGILKYLCVRHCRCRVPLGSDSAVLFTMISRDRVVLSKIRRNGTPPTFPTMRQMRMRGTIPSSSACHPCRCGSTSREDGRSIKYMHAQCLHLMHPLLYPAASSPNHTQSTSTQLSR